MKKLIITTIALILVCICLNSCQHKVVHLGEMQYDDSIVVQSETAYLPAIALYLTNEIGKHYEQAEHCVPYYSIVATDESNSNDVLVWGDFWILNYNLSGDTLKCVSGGNYAGLMHLTPTNAGYKVTDFEQVADGSGYIESARTIFKDHFREFQSIQSDFQGREELRRQALEEYAEANHLKAVMYQDYGWPAKRIRE